MVQITYPNLDVVIWQVITIINLSRLYVMQEFSYGMLCFYTSSQNRRTLSIHLIDACLHSSIPSNSMEI